MCEDEKTKYRKKSSKKGKKRANHKHEYEEVLIRNYPYAFHKVCLMNRCKVCGNLRAKEILMINPVEDGYSTMMTNEEILEKYKDLEIFDYEKLE